MTYTYEDWLEGNIPEPINDKKSDKLNYWTYISNPSRIEESEFQKIRSQQKKIFFELVQKHSDELFSTFFYECTELNSDDQTEFLKIEIKNVTERLKNYDLLKNVKLGRWDPKAVTSTVCKNYLQSKYFPIKGHKTESGLGITFPEKHENINGEVFYSEDPSTEERIGDVIPNLGGLYKAHVDFLYKKELESISELIPLDSDFTEERITEGDLTEEELPNILSKEKRNPYHAKCKQIFESAESIPAGKFEFIDFIKSEFGLRSQELALKKANKIYNEVSGKNLYKNIGSYQASLSKYHKQRRH